MTKMANKFMKRTFQNDDSSSTTSTLENNDSEENDLNQRKERYLEVIRLISEVYARNLALIGCTYLLAEPGIPRTRAGA